MRKLKIGNKNGYRNCAKHIKGNSKAFSNPDLISYIRFPLCSHAKRHVFHFSLDFFPFRIHANLNPYD